VEHEPIGYRSQRAKEAEKSPYPIRHCSSRLPGPELGPDSRRLPEHWHAMIIGSHDEQPLDVLRTSRPDPIAQRRPTGTSSANRRHDRLAITPSAKFAAIP
jgi:hypothetical protein